jgi:hypothetical protein
MLNEILRASAALLAAAMILPAAAGCKKGGISVGEASSLMNELAQSGAIDLGEIEAEAADAAQAAADKKAAELAEKEAQRQAAKEALNQKNNTPATPKVEEPKITAESKINNPVEAVPLANPELYSAPAFTPEVLDPADTREFKILGAAYSDGTWAVAYGECKVGAFITAVNADGETATVQSQGGCFALRFHAPKIKATLTLTQSYNGEQIGEPLKWEGRVETSSYDDDDNWMVLIGGGNQGFYRKMIADFEHTNLLSEKQMTSITEKFKGRVEKLQEVGDGCELICLLAPASMTIYPELAPDSVKQGEGESRYDQVKKVLTDAGVIVIDPRETFTAHKNDALPIYYDYDSHWTEYGAYLAYVELYDYISDRYPAAKPREFSEFNWEWDYYTRGDMPWYFDVDQGGLVYEWTFKRNFNFDCSDVTKDGKSFDLKNMKRYKLDYSVSYPAYVDEISESHKYTTGNEELPDIYVFRNSYGAALFDLLIERSNRCTFNTMFSYTFNMAQIKQSEPDYVIYCVTEWELNNIYDN